MPKEYLIKRLRALEEEIGSLNLTLETARNRGNKKLMGLTRKRLEVASNLHDMYERMLARGDTF